MRFILLTLIFFSQFALSSTLRVATFNVSMDATNYTKKGDEVDPSILQKHLSSGKHQQIKNVAEIIQRVAPDILLLNEFDYIENTQLGARAFVNNYLNISQNNQTAINYPYIYTAPVNTGVATKFDLNNDGIKSGTKNDAFGFGFYPGHYGMVLLSKYKIDTNAIKTLQYFKWKDMPNARKPFHNKQAYYSDEQWQALRLSSKSHWDIPVIVDGEAIHILALHPTPPVFDGPEDRNGKRNADEIRLISDYIDPTKSAYIYNDQGQFGGLKKDRRFVILGDLNAADSGEKHRVGVIEQLTENALVNNNFIPSSAGAQQQFKEFELGQHYTASWAARVDYVLPSRMGLQVRDGGVFWPAQKEQTYSLINKRASSSDHRLVWLDVQIIK